MRRSLNRAERLQEMERLYFQRGYSDIEMAERLGVDRTTVFRDRTELETQMPFIQQEDGRYRIDRTRYLSSIRLNLNEALALYLAARRASQQTRSGQPHTASALEKLALALRQPMTSRLVQAADRILAQQNQPERLKILETLTQAWVEGRQVRFSYRGLHGRRALNYRVDPYLIEPSPWSDGVYLIGRSDVHGEIAVFKTDRIESISLTSETFSLPEDFSEDALLKYAWGIWISEREPYTVTLRFAAGAAARRLAESIWHPTQVITPLPEGGCLWQALVAEWQEMLPWVRGWGAEVEVLEPEELREALVRETRRMAELYCPGEKTPIPPYMLLWAKADRQTYRIHLLIYHMMDVAQVALALWQNVLPPSVQQQFADALQRKPQEIAQLIAFLTGLHDLGKASPAFQKKFTPGQKVLEGAGFDFPEITGGKSAYHSTVTTFVLNTLLVVELGWDRRSARKIATALGGHHGAWPAPINLIPPAISSNDIGQGIWEQVRIQFVRILADLFTPLPMIQLPEDQEAQNAFLVLLSGLTSVADWIGSMERFFPYEDQVQDITIYSQRATAQAETALRQLGWLGGSPQGKPSAFEDLFSFPPNLIQQAVIENIPPSQEPTLVILEAPTGIGKTEAALYLADNWLHSQSQKGFYVAMPSMATSNQMFGRVRQFLEKRYPKTRINLHLIHSQSSFQEQAKEIEMSAIGEEALGHVAAMTWFLPRKRTLLAPFGVGTVDQTLMSVLQTRHFFVRLFGLSHKTIIFDEVHAYDTYMSALFQRLLNWLHQLGASVVLLSATLPSQTRRQLVEAYLHTSISELPQGAYPLLTRANQQGIEIINLPSPAERKVSLEWISPQPEDIANWVTPRVVPGGCAAVICNTVNRAQQVYQAIVARGQLKPEEIILFHARYPAAWRDEIEQRVLGLFSKNGQRPQRAVLVATQVVEQSLDLDFDLMVSDLAPVDLIIQRAGRLHRHAGRSRQEHLQKPLLAIASPQVTETIPDLEPHSFIYDPYILLGSLLALQQKEALFLPGDTTSLIEAVYQPPQPDLPLSPSWQAALESAYQTMLQEQSQELFQASTRLVRLPDAEDLLSQGSLDLAEDDPAVHKLLQALTRLIEPGIQLVCLHQTGQGLLLDPEDPASGINLDVPPSQDELEKLLRHSVNLQHRVALHYFTQQPVPKPWKESPALRNHRPAIFTNGVCRLGGSPYHLSLSRTLGIQIEKEA